MTYARIENNLVIEICNTPDGFTIEQCFHPSLVEQMKPCGSNVECGWSYVDGSFIAPEASAPEEPIAEAPVTDEPSA